jgi:tryptophan-rich sensory protein
MSAAIKLILSLLICYAAAAIGGFATASSVTDWYLGLNKPSFNPPSWLFGPVWTILYTAMAIALWKVWSLPYSDAQKTAIMWFAIQLLLNILWSFLFFYWKWPLGGFIEIIFMWISILITIIHFYSLVPWTIALLLPYLIWVSFASLLNGAIYWLN